MNHRMRRIVETLACERRYGIADAKGAEYSGKGSTYKETGADTLANFKNVAERIGGTPEQVLMTYLLKHIDSINTAVREAGTLKPPFIDKGPCVIYAAGEGIVSRLDDARNYLDLLECLLIDNGHIEEQTDEQGELYKQIGVGAAESAVRIDDGGLKPHQHDRGPKIGYGENIPIDSSDANLDPAGISLNEYNERAMRGDFDCEGKGIVPAPWPALEPVTVAEMNEARSMAAPWAELTLEEKVREHETGQIKGHDGVWRPRAAPEGTKIVPPLCWGGSDQENPDVKYGETGELT